MKASIAFFLTGMAIVISMPAHAAAKPNIVFILADDLGYAELGSYGQKRINTPNLDRLAAEGMRWTRHYSGNAVCAPSRCVLMTGKHPGHAYVRNNKSVEPEGQQPIPASEVTLAELLAEQGYATGAFGKWGLGPTGSSGDPNDQGFRRFFGYNCQAHAHSYYPATLWSDREKIALRNDPPVPGHAGLRDGANPNDPRSYDAFKGQDYAPDRINQQALDFIREHQDRPFFLYYPTIIPHVALHVPDEDLAPYLAEQWEDPPFTREEGRGYTPHFTPRAAYAAMISRLDMYVGRLMGLLEELGLAERTMVIFTSDNGTTHLRAEVDYEFFDSVGPLRGLKGTLWEGGVRVPLIVRWPGQVAPGTVSDYLSGFEDWMPTLLDAIGAKDRVPESVDGISLLPTLRGEIQPARSFLYREFTGYGGQQAVWMGPWKGIRRDMLRRNNPEPLRTALYHVASDPGEAKDVSSTYPEVLQRIETIMAEQHTPSEVFPFPVLD